MPKGELFIRSKRTIQAGSGTGIIDAGTEDRPSWVEDTGWVDAFVRYGMSLEPGGLSALMRPPTMKQPTGASLAGVNGVAYDGETIGKYDERTLGIDMHIVAASKAQYKERYDLMCDEVLSCGYFQLRVNGCDKFFHFIYQDCQTFDQFNREQAKFTISVLEPHPEIIDSRTPRIMQ